MKLIEFIPNKSQVISYILLFLLFTCLTLFFYNGLEKIYFQQDEWFKTGKSIYYLYSDFGSLWTKRFGFHYYPLLNLYFIGEYLLFKMNVQLYMYVSLLLQGVVGVLVYVFFRKIFNHTFFAFLLTFLFLVNPGIHQVTLNEMVSSSYKIPLILMLISFIILYDAIQKSGVFQYKKLIILSLIYIISVAFFEGALVMIVLLPLFYILFKNKNLTFEFNRRNVTILVSLVILTILRLIFQNILPVDAPLPIEGSFIVSTLYNATTTPFKFLIEYLLNLENIYSLGRMYASKIFVLKNNPAIDTGTIGVTTGYEIVVYFVTAIFAFITAFIIAISNKISVNQKKYLAIILFATIWLVINSVVIAPQGRIFNTLESRYLYLSGIGVLLIVGSLILLLWRSFNKYNLFRIAFYVGIILYLVWWSCYSFKILNQEKNILLSRSIARETFVKEFIKLYPTLPDSSVIYIYCTDDCSSNAAIGMRPEWVVPFQNGVGWVLLIMYSEKNPQKYAPFFSNYLFWDNKSAGYRKIEDTAFGFYTDKKALKAAIQKYALLPSDILFVGYKSKEFKPHKMKNTEELYMQLIK